MIAREQFASLIGGNVYDRNGDKIGSLGQVYVDTATNEPAWASVNTGLFGLGESLVPISQAEARDGGVRVPYDKATVKDAPNIDASADEPLSSDEVAQLYQHYQLGGGGYTAESYDERGTSAAGYTAGSSHAGQAYSGDETRPGGHADDDAMTRSEERLTVDTERQAVGTARLRKYVVTDQVQTTVPVRREEVRLEREPVTDANAGAAFAGADITESEHEVTLHAERPVVDTETVPVERVRLGKETVTEQETVSGEVRKEQIEFDGPEGRGRDRR
ncbi:MAG TPA: PRC and DUF2382 domain-containing protein [Pilimelia sp.]|nr:PRC and DUF2382 domain-containing protein [Pilimelia sp.]